MDFESRLKELADGGAGKVVDWVAAAIGEGLRRGASDIHLEPSEGAIELRYRLDGVLHPAIRVPMKHAQNAIARVKVLANLLTYRTDVPQEGRIDREAVGAESDLRVSTFPTVRGEKAVIRLFDPETQDVGLDRLGYPAPLLDELKRQLQMPKGMILLTGPAGSGKTTTIYAGLRFILDQSGGAKNIVTVEDPVERMLRGVTQTQVHPATGLTFARCLRSMMRQDPEVIVVGEIRDRETGGIAVEAGLTGHLVISTIHSGTAAGVFTRLLEMQIEPHLLNSAVNFVVAQRLIRKLCAKCRRPISDEHKLLGLPESSLGTACAAAGCPACYGTGYSGRTVIVEALTPTDGVRRAVVERAATETIAGAARAEGMTPLAERAMQAARDAVTSPTELLRVMGPGWNKYEG